MKYSFLQVDPLHYLSILCKARMQYGMYLSVDADMKTKADVEETLRAVPWLSKVDCAALISQGMIFVFFDDELSMKKAFDRVVGDDGPTHFNEYAGPCRVYAMECDSDGNFDRDNT